MNVTNASSNRIQVFDPEESFYNMGRGGKDDREFDGPSGICIDILYILYGLRGQSCNRVSGFTCDGKFLTSFGSPGDDYRTV